MKKLLPLLLFPILPLLASESSNSLLTYESKARGNQLKPHPNHTPPLYQKVEDPHVLAPYGAVLVWTSIEENLGYAITGLTNGEDVPPGGMQTVRKNFRPGVRVGLAMKHPKTDTEVTAEYTGYFNHSSKNVKNDTIMPTWNVGGELDGPYTIGEFQSSKGEHNLKYNVMDLRIERSYFLSPHLFLRSYAGLEGTLQEVRYEASYLKNIGDTYTTTNHQVMSGVGISGGFDFSYQIIKALSIYADLQIAELWTHFKVHRKDKKMTQALLTTELLDTTNSFHSIKAHLDGKIGIRMATAFQDGRYRIHFDLAWEQNVWLNYNQFVRLVTQSSHGSLSLMGFSAKFRLDF